MHEYSIVASLIDVCEKEAKTHHAKAIKRLEVSIGRLSGIEIHFLEQEKVQLENFVNDLKSQKHKLSSWITRTKKQNDIKNNDWNAPSKC